MGENTAHIATATATARRLLEGAPNRPRDSRLAGEALQEACTRIVTRLRDSLGDDGCNAMLARALARTEGRHPALRKISRIHGDRIQIDGVGPGIDEFGVGAATAAIEALLAALIDILGRLVGEDMALRLIDGDSHSSRNGTKP